MGEAGAGGAGPVVGISAAGGRRAGVVAPYRDGLSGVRWVSGDRPVRTPAPTGLCHRTWFEKTGVGTHTAQPLAALPPTDAAYPLRVVCARPHPGRRASIEQAHQVRPDARYTETSPGSTAAFAAPGQRFDLQVPGASRAREAERQRRFITRLKTGVHSQDTFCCARATAAASEATQ